MLDLNVDGLASHLAGLRSLKTRRLVFDVTFVYKRLNGFIDCPELIQKIGLKVLSFNSRNNLLYPSPIKLFH